MSKVIIISLISVLIGFSIGKFLNQPKEEKVEITTEIKTEDDSRISQQMLELEEKAKKDLENITEADQKIEYMQKLYGEMFQLFLANLAIKLDKNFWEDVKEANEIAKDEVKKVEPIPEATQTPEVSIVENNNFIEPEDKTLPNIQLNQQEYKESQKFSYRSGKLINPTDYYMNSRTITGGNNRMIQRVQGRFRGDALMKDPKDKNWNIMISSQLNYIDKKWTGDVQIELASDDRGVFSRSNGTGENSSFNQHPEDPGSIIIEASPDIFLHLKWRKSREIFNGYVYKQSRDNKKWTLIGYIPYLRRE